MTSVTFPTKLGGSGVTISDDADPNTGLLNGGHRQRFVPGLEGVVDMANYVYQYADKIDNAASDAQRAEDARAYVEGYAAALRSNLRAEYDAQATLLLDFENGNYRLATDDGTIVDHTQFLIVERSTPKLAFGPDGLLREVPINTLAREWDPVTGKCLGLLFEGQSVTNNVIYSNKIGDTANGWLVENCGVTLNAAMAPNGREEATLLTVLDGDKESRPIQSSIPVTPGGDITGSVFAKRSGDHPLCGSFFVRVYVNDGWTYTGMRFKETGDGQFDVKPGDLTRHYEIKPVGDDWYRISFIIDGSMNTADETRLYINLAASIDTSYPLATGQQMLVWQADVCVYERITSPIVTAGSAVTRAGDSIRIEPRRPLNLRRGTLSVDFENIGNNRVSDDGGSTVLSLGIGTNTRVAFEYSNAGNLRVYSPLANYALAGDDAEKMTVTFDTNAGNMSAYTKGGRRINNQDYDAGNDPVGIYIGSRPRDSSYGYRNYIGHYRRISLYPMRLPESIVEELDS